VRKYKEASKGVIPLAKKEIVTAREMLQDIVNTLQYPAAISKKSHIKRIFLIVLCVALSCMIGVIFPKFLLIEVFVLAPLFWSLFWWWRNRRYTYLSKKIRIEDYEIKSDVLLRRELDTYEVTGDRYHPVMTVYIYKLFFESGGQWNIPETRNYRWSERNAKWDSEIFNLSEEGAAFITVVEKSSGKVAVAYPADLFEYKETRSDGSLA
jgi:hypothetical protein